MAEESDEAEEAAESGERAVAKGFTRSDGPVTDTMKKEGFRRKQAKLDQPHPFIDRD
jgi:hypothetical protein